MTGEIERDPPPHQALRTRPADNRSGSEDSGRHEPVEALEPATGELLGVVESYTGSLDQEGFHSRCVRFGSVREMTRSLLGGRSAGRRGEEERLSKALRALWERWAPDEPFFERFDDAMLRGSKADDRVEKCEIWLEAWRDIVRIADRLALASIREIDDRFQGCEHVFNWVQDLEMELLNAGADDPRLLRECIRFCEELLARFPGVDRLTVENFRRSMAECRFRLGETETGDRLYRRWLEADPTWGWGWIGWSDAYWLFADPGGRGFARAAEILEQGLAVDGLRDRRDLLDRAAEVYDELGRDEDARRVRRELRRRNASAPSAVWRAQPGMQVGQVIDFGDPGLPLERLPDLQAALTGRPATATSRKIGRNEPCPCGSGTKYKKCCGRAR